MPSSFDVVVIGAGLAGIAATERLTDAGLRVALVEARDRLGGRVFTRRDPAVDYPLELGPEWFDSSGAIHRLLSADAVAMPEARGHFLRRAGDQLRDIEEISDGGGDLHRRLQALHGPDRPVARALQQCCANVQATQAAAMLHHYIEGFHAADPDEMSLKWWTQVESVQPADASQRRSRAGLDAAVRQLARGIGPAATVFLNTAVARVRWRRGGVAVDCVSGSTRGTLTAPRAVVTLPLAILRLPPTAPGAVEFFPGLASKRVAFERLRTGPVVKVNLVFDRPFWQALPHLRDALFVQDFSQPIPTWWTTRPVEAPVLVGWAAGPQVARVGSTEADELIRTAVASLSHALAVPPGTVTGALRSWHWHDWQRDPLAQGAYSWVATGGVTAHRTLAAPLGNTLYFAGEATRGDGYNATMDGAIESGWRAAAELLKSW